MAELHRVVLPTDQDSERAYLASLLADPAKTAEGITTLNEEWFFGAVHRLTARAMVEIQSGGGEINAFTLSSQLQKQPETAQLGVDTTAYSIDICSDMPTSANAGFYKEKVVEFYNRRQAIYGAEKVMKMAANPSEQYQTCQSEIQKMADASASMSLKKTLEGAEVTQGYRARIKSAAAGRKTPKLPFFDWDQQLGGLEPGKLHYVAGRPGMGKTAFLSAVAMALANQRQGRVLVFSLEMTTDEYISRLACSLAMVSMRRLDFGNATQKEYDAVEAALNMIDRANLVVEEKPDITATEIRAIVSSYRRKGPIAMVGIDYLQYMGWDGPSNTEKRLVVGSNSTRLKTMAKELQVPVMCLAQLNRSVEKREDKRPELSDLAESGSIENDADSVTFLFRPSYYNKEERDPFTREKTQLIVAKNRNGMVGMSEVWFTPAYTRFDQMSRKTLFENEG